MPNQTYRGPILVVRQDEYDALQRSLVHVNREVALDDLKRRLKRAISDRDDPKSINNAR